MDPACCYQGSTKSSVSVLSRYAKNSGAKENEMSGALRPIVQLFAKYPQDPHGKVPCSKKCPSPDLGPKVSENITLLLLPSFTFSTLIPVFLHFVPREAKHAHPFHLSFSTRSEFGFPMKKLRFQPEPVFNWKTFMSKVFSCDFFGTKPSGGGLVESLIPIYSDHLVVR